jgi:predicted unusual protein kinase regulating ubiquinone biosynthesis (AarF/ABC1/UbiB family)
MIRSRPRRSARFIAVLRDGREVAVKIQYPGVAEAIRVDLANTEMLASMLRFMTSAVGAVADFRVVAREASARISEAVDYRHEAAMIARFDELYELRIGSRLMSCTRRTAFAAGRRRRR